MIHTRPRKEEPLPGDDIHADDTDEDAPPKRPPLGELKTEEEDRLAAEIEKLRRSD